MEKRDGVQVTEASGVQTILEALDRYFEAEVVVAGAAGLLRHLAKSDDVKILFVAIDGYCLARRLLDTHTQSARVVTQV
jgi:hypothetical protein